MLNHKAIPARFVHVAETEISRKRLGPVDYSTHAYPFDVIFKGAYEEVDKWPLYHQLLKLSSSSSSGSIVLPGYSSIEHWLMLLSARLSGKKVGVFCDSTIRDRKQNALKSILKRFFFANCKAVFAYGQRSREYLNYLGVPDQNIFFPCQAAASLKISMQIDEIIAYRLAALTGPGRTFCYVGRLSPEKNLLTMISAWAKHQEQSSADRLRIIGDGPQRAEIEETIRRHGLEDSITLTGPLIADQLAGEYLRAHALLLPSLSEPWGLVVNEAFYYGCPAIVSKACGCVPELIETTTGHVFEPDDESHLLELLGQISTDPAMLASTARQCRAVIDQYTPEAAAKNILRGIEQLTQGQPT